MWNKHSTEIIYVGQWPIFHGPFILPYILKTIWWTNVIIGILDPCNAKIYQIKCMWVSDLHFMVQWVCLISWRLFDGLLLYWRYWFNLTQTLSWNYICRPVTYITWSSNSDISWRRFHGGMLDWRYWFRATLSLTYKYIYIYRSVTYILSYSDSA